MLNYDNLWPPVTNLSSYHDHDNEIKDKREQIWQDFEANGHDANPNDYLWLEEIATNHNRFPNLTRVRIGEDTYRTSEGGGEYRSWVEHPWDIPPPLRETFDLAGIELDVVLRRPEKVGRCMFLSICSPSVLQYSAEQIQAVVATSL